MPTTSCPTTTSQACPKAALESLPRLTCSTCNTAYSLSYRCQLLPTASCGLLVAMPATQVCSPTSSRTLPLHASPTAQAHSSSS